MDKNELRIKMEAVLQAFDNYCSTPGEKAYERVYDAANEVLSLCDPIEPEKAALPQENQKAEIAISDNLKIVAEVNPDPAGYKEIFVALEEDGVQIQDLAMIGQKYHYSKKNLNVENEPNTFRVLVWGDPKAEDYTDWFEIEKRQTSRDLQTDRSARSNTKKSR